jgi:hypothetical protein
MCRKCEMMAKRRRRRRSKKGVFGVGKIGSIPTEQILAMGAGALTAKIADPLLNKIPLKAIQDNQLLKDGIKAGLGVFMAMQKDSMIANAGLGMTAYAVASAVGGFIPADLFGGGDTASRLAGTGRYQIGTGPSFLAGSRQAYVAGTQAGTYGLGTQPEMLAGYGYDNVELVA